ncbi:MAG: hypothetical protein UHW99_02005 [Methanobrevibacter sp.]|uniref:hypothetical protein n=1 Tax=uncultured Methanobrevibacter sp. TaxID=253161 RepID=UPI0025EC2100|nr:hypothetical protein [uncultured Methanobrevibacter sp.]MEE1128735.1 hypothetical protein [Methanobrevibacter sp.]
MNEDLTTIHITEVLSSSLIMDLMDEYPNLSEITCAPSVYERTSKNYIDALEQLDIDVKKKYNWGAKSQTNGQEKVVLDLAKKGLKAREIAEKLDIKLNRVYYLLRKNKDNVKFDNYKRKHDRSEIKSLKEEGLKPREISEKLDIPLRTVYYILNKK